MPLAGKKSRLVLILIAALLPMSILLSCGSPEPTATPQLKPPQSSTETTFGSPLAEPTATPAIVGIPSSASPSPTGTPDPNRTPVAIVQAELEPDREVITIQNISQVDQDISGWTLFNLEAVPVFIFPENVVLKPGETVQVYSAVSESEVPAGAFFWTQERIWTEVPANVMLLNKATRLVYWYVDYADQ
jgi:hypothetical protein